MEKFHTNRELDSFGVLTEEGQVASPEFAEKLAYDEVGKRDYGIFYDALGMKNSYAENADKYSSALISTEIANERAKALQELRMLYGNITTLGEVPVTVGGKQMYIVWTTPNSSSTEHELFIKYGKNYVRTSELPAEAVLAITDQLRQMTISTNSESSIEKSME